MWDTLLSAVSSLGKGAAVVLQDDPYCWFLPCMLEGKELEVFRGVMNNDSVVITWRKPLLKVVKMALVLAGKEFDSAEELVRY